MPNSECVTGQTQTVEAEKPLISGELVPLDELAASDLVTLEEVGRYLKNHTARRVREKYVNTGLLPVVELSPRVRRVRVAALRLFLSKLSTDEDQQERALRRSRRGKR